MTWNDVTLEKYQQLVDIENDNKELIDKNSAYISVLFDVPYSEELSLREYNRYTCKLKFLSTPLPKPQLKAKYDNYVLHKQVGNITMAQYIDFKTYAMRGDVAGCLSCFLIPEGKTYLEGYDVEEVKEYINKMPIPDVIAIQGFFLLYLKRFTQLSLICLHIRTRNQERKTKLKRILKKLLPAR